MGFENGFYILDTGKLIYLSRTAQGFMAESHTGSTCKVDEELLESWSARKIEPETYSQEVEAHKTFIKSKLEQLAQSEKTETDDSIGHDDDPMIL